MKKVIKCAFCARRCYNIHTFEARQYCSAICHTFHQDYVAKRKIKKLTNNL